jgi:hypothetical protein
MSKSVSKIIFFDMIRCLNDNVAIYYIYLEDKLYWLDSKSDREELYKLWKESDE